MMEIIPQGNGWSAGDVVDLLSMIWSGVSQSSDIYTGLQEMGWRGFQREHYRQTDGWSLSTSFSSMSEVTVFSASPQITTSAQKRAIKAIKIFCPPRWQTCCQSSSPFTELIPAGIVSPFVFSLIPDSCWVLIINPQGWQYWIWCLASNEEPRW